ncbi:hypothetical protein [Planococcus sp. ISL-109]|uniref:hypothetical protein n=1 Tax=Planococcus sp. ISL-109 TaxID=2819166 RepID=UPI001BE54E18|nr:hypothetical protein [Planococcus sp. ISL-109]MBT2581610.1 hypothetical protein [Planococcus sp. ISL-109]
MMKKLLDLFFEDDSQQNNDGHNNYFLVFAVWGSILLVNGIFEYFTETALIESSFLILMIGLVVFFAAESFGKKSIEARE